MYVVLYNLEYTPPLIIRRAKNCRDGLYAAAYIRENTVSAHAAGVKTREREKSSFHEPNFSDTLAVAAAGVYAPVKHAR